MDRGRLNEIFNDASEAVVVSDSQGVLLYFNNAAQALFQYSTSEFEGYNLLNLLSNDSHEEILSFLNKNPDGQKYVLEQEALIIPKNGTPLRANVLLSTITHEKGNIHMMVAEPLAAQESLPLPDYQLLAESLAEVVSFYDDQHRCLYVNPAVRDFYGYQPADYQTKGGLLGRVTQQDKDLLTRQFEEDTQQQVYNKTYHYQAYHRDGTTIQVEATIRRFYDVGGKLYRLIAFEKSAEAQSASKRNAHQVPMLLLNGDWKLTYMNQEASEVLDTSATQDSFSKLIHPDDIPKLEEEQEGTIYNGIVRTQRQLKLQGNNGYQAFRIIFDKFFDESGLLTYTTLRLYPADPQDKSPQADRSQFLKLLAEHVDEVVCFFQQDFSFRYVSPSVTQALGYTPEELEGKNIFELIHPEERTSVEEVFRQTMTAPPNNLNCRFKTKNGNYLPLQLDFRMLESQPESPKLLPFLALLRHVPHLQDMTNPATIFTEVSDHLTDALAMVALPSLTISRVNQPCLRLFQTERTILEGKSFLSLFEESEALHQLEEALRRAEDSFQEDLRCLDQEQKPFWANIAVSFFLSGEQKHALMRITDISERKAREEQLRQAHQEAENILKSREEFLSTMSHEIRTPLNAILGMTHLMLQGQPREDQVKLLQTLKFSGDSLTALINDILDFSKIEAGKLEFAQDDFNLREFLHSIKLTYKNLAQDKGLIFRTLLEEELPDVVNGDVHRLGQILNNLLNNAIKFTEDGYIILSVYVESEEEDHYLLLFEVADTGIGIPEEKQAVIFDPYQQASQRTSRYFGGTGLGLSIVKKLVEQVNGEIHLESEEGRGTTFKIKLRFARSENKNAVESDSDRSFIHEFQPLDGLKVLYVEDVIPNQFLMEGLCDTWHIQLDTALDGLEALEKVKNNHYDLILMDIHMPGMDGFEAAQEIRNLRDPHYSNVPILALSASVSDKTRKRILEQGMDDYIAKPINPRALHQKLHQYAKSASTTMAEGDTSWETQTEPENIPDTPDFSQLQELYMSDREGYVTIIRQVLKLSEESASTIREALRLGNKEQFRSSGHKIMSYVRLLNLERLLELMEEIKLNFEKYSRSPQDTIQRLNAHFNRLVEALQEEIQQKG
jgi:PAS domain S-box-containing protein